MTLLGFAKKTGLISAYSFFFLATTVRQLFLAQIMRCDVKKTDFLYLQAGESVFLPIESGKTAVRNEKREFMFPWIPFKSLVGMKGFEPSTPWTPFKCAPRLRYIPTRKVYLRGTAGSVNLYNHSRIFPLSVAQSAANSHHTSIISQPYLTAGNIAQTSFHPADCRRRILPSITNFLTCIAPRTAQS